jgi:hypothetical protein
MFNTIRKMIKNVFNNYLYNILGFVRPAVVVVVRPVIRPVHPSSSSRKKKMMEQEEEDEWQQQQIGGGGEFGLDI